MSSENPLRVVFVSTFIVTIIIIYIVFHQQCSFSKMPLCDFRRRLPTTTTTETETHYNIRIRTNTTIESILKQTCFGISPKYAICQLLCAHPTYHYKRKHFYALKFTRLTFTIYHLKPHNELNVIILARENSTCRSDMSGSQKHSKWHRTYRFLFYHINRITFPSYYSFLFIFDGMWVYRVWVYYHITQKKTSTD